MACIFDMRRLHHGCGESLLVRPLKPECIFMVEDDEQQVRTEKMRAESRRTKSKGRARRWE